MKRHIRIIAYDRPHSLRECVESLKKCRLLDRFSIAASIDARPDGAHNSEVVAIARQVTADVRLRPRLGCNKHVHLNFQEAVREEYDFYLHLEDDIVLAQDALEMAIKFEPMLRDRQDIKQLAMIGQDIAMDEAYRQHMGFKVIGGWSNAWGMYCDRESIESFLREIAGDFAGEPTWDCQLTELFRAKGWSSLAFALPRSRNIGRRGAHCHSDEAFGHARRRTWSQDLIIDLHKYREP